MLAQPEIIREIHDAYLEVGADVIETNTFNAQAISRADYGLEDVAYKIDLAAAKIAREAADAWTKKRRRTSPASSPAPSARPIAPPRSGRT